MKKSDVDLLAEAFNEATALVSDEKAQFVANFTAEHPSLGEKLRRLLKLDASQDDILHGLVSDAASAMGENAKDPWLGKSFGPWTISKRIGAGGMGAVFLAHRGDGAFEQNVAIKVMGSQILSETTAARFRFERQTLANLRHRNIATLIDGGSTDLNLPYLVMEYIEGSPIDDYCEERNLSLADRLTLFQKVCRTVHYAHRNLIVHRDLKPDNILVEENGEPKLLDFGVARLIEQQDKDDEESQAGIQLTQPGSRILTLEYASPEQVRGETVTIATDIYALGVLLYRLLADASPYGDKPTTIRDFEDVILNHVPKPPSTASSVVGNSRASDPNGEKAPTFRRAKRLSHDLDNIVLKCLQKDPDHRYSSAKELSDDLSRYLNNEPVEARPAAWWYVAGKFLKRNVAAATATGAALILLIGVTGFYTFRLAVERDNARSAAAQATLAASEADEVSDFLINLFQASNPEVAKGADITARDLLRQGEEQISQLDDQPLVQARLLEAIGFSYYNLDDFDKALSMLTRSQDILDEHPEASLESIMATAGSLAEVQRSLELHDESIRNRKIALEAAETLYGPNRETTIFALVRLGVSYYSASDYDQALAILREATDRIERSDQRDEIRSSDTFNQILALRAVIHGRRGEARDALPLYVQVTQNARRLLGDNHPNTIISIGNEALALDRIYEFDQSTPLWRDAAKRSADVNGSAHSQTRYENYQLAHALSRLGQFDEARQILEREREIAVKEHGEFSFAYGEIMLSLCRWHVLKGQFAAAIDLCSETSDVWIATGHSEKRRGAKTFLMQGHAFFGLGKWREARDAFEKALSTEQSLILLDTLDARRGLASANAELGDAQGAAKELNLILKQQESLFGDDSAALLDVLSALANVYQILDDDDAAEQQMRRAAALAKSGLPDGNWMAAQAEGKLALLLAARGKLDEARTLAAQAADDLSTVFGPDDSRVKALKSIST
ncbi:serine/threonine-protein kinase [Hyphococcus sp.]|uniref:serine/threonine-protein kinase n=1 Tax=Hyphococcus sp. TaxID=2038636 RepID=UPI002088B2D5|nr:MAG: hypothetical protein DHS20C04_17900 [Marinicaulis sp.]